MRLDIGVLFESRAGLVGLRQAVLLADFASKPNGSINWAISRSLPSLWLATTIFLADRSFIECPRCAVHDLDGVAGRIAEIDRTAALRPLLEIGLDG